ARDWKFRSTGISSSLIISFSDRKGRKRNLLLPLNHLTDLGNPARNKTRRVQHGVQEVLFGHDFNQVVLLVGIFIPVTALSTTVDGAEAISRSEISLESATDTNRNEASFLSTDERNKSAVTIIASFTSVNEC